MKKYYSVKERRIESYAIVEKEDNTTHVKVNSNGLTLTGSCELVKPHDIVFVFYLSGMDSFYNFSISPPPFASNLANLEKHVKDKILRCLGNSVFAGIHHITIEKTILFSMFETAIHLLIISNK